MAPENSNWLSFSLSPMEMLSNSSASQSQMLQSTAPYDGSSAAAQPYCFVDNYYYANGWENARSPGVYGGGENEVKEVMRQSIADSSIFTTFAGEQIQQETAPKLEDFLGGNSSSMVQYSDSQTETQDSSLTQIYEQRGSPYFNVHSQDFRTVQAMAAGLQAFSSNSGSEVDDSVSVAGSTRVNCRDFGGQSTESGTELAFPQSNPGALSLGGNNTQNTEKALVSVDSGSCKKIVDTFGQRTSIYRGVTRHRWTGRYEAHLWDNSCRREGQARKGRQVYLGGYDKEERAARSYDLAALKYWGATATTNFPVSSYAVELEEMKHVTKQEFIASLRRKSSGFSRGASKYRGVTRHHQQGRWQARIGRVAGNKDLYLGTFATQEEAAEAYDIAAIKFRGANAVTNFEMNRYDVEAIMTSSLPVGGAAKRLKLSLEAEQKPNLNHHTQQLQCSGNSFNFSTIQQLPAIPCEVPLDAMARYHHNLLQLHSSTAMASDTTGSVSSMATPFTFLPPQGEYFIWPQQNY